MTIAQSARFQISLVLMPGSVMDIVMTITIKLTAVMMEGIAAIITIYILTNIAKIVTAAMMNGPRKNAKRNVKLANV